MTNKQIVDLIDEDPFWSGTQTRGEMKLDSETMAEIENQRLIDEAISELEEWGNSQTFESGDLVQEQKKTSFHPLRMKQKELLNAVSIGHDTVVKLLAVGFGGQHGQPQSKRNNVNKALFCLCQQGYLERNSVIRTTERNTKISEYRYTVKEK